MSKSQIPLSHYRIKKDPQKQSFKIFSKKKDHDEIIKFLLRRGLFVKDHRNFTNHFLEIDYRGLSALLNEGETELQIKARELPDLSDLQDKISQEEKIAEELEDKELRIWEREENGKIIYCVEVDGDIYSGGDLHELVSFLKGDFLIESDKPITSLSLNPAAAFGVFNVLYETTSSSKSVVRYNFSQGKRKKQFHPLIETTHNFRIVIDGADDTANALNNTGLPQQTVALLQGLLIFPTFLKGVHLGYDGLGEEAKETHDEFRAAHIKRAEIEVKLEQFKRDLCAKCAIDYDSVKDRTANKFLKTVALKIQQLDDENLRNEITNLAAQYNQEVKKDFDAPRLRDVLAAHCGWLAMTSMMTSVGVYEAQAAINIFGGVDKISTSNNGSLPLLSTVGNAFGFGGQALMTCYAFHKMLDEHKGWKEAEEELEKFRNAKDVSDLARQITEELLEAKRNNHRLQTYGNAALSAGQAMMAIGGPVGIGLNPLLYAGLISTLGGVAVNSISELRYQTSYQINEEMDELERKIITQPPQFKKDDFSNINQALAEHAKRKITELEILGHLRAPQLALYQKFHEKNQDEVGVIGKAVSYFGGERFSRWLNKPPSASTDLVKKNPLIKAHDFNKNDLDIFKVEPVDFERGLEQYYSLTESGKSHSAAIKEIQTEFIQQKSAAAHARPPKTTKELCASIIEAGGASGSYLTKKLMRAVANGDLNHKGSLESGAPEISKNGKKIILAKLDLDEFDEAKLTDFLEQKRKQKRFGAGLEKKSPLEAAHDKENYAVKSDHLRPFSHISTVSTAATENPPTSLLRASLSQLQRKKSRQVSPL